MSDFDDSWLEAAYEERTDYEIDMMPHFDEWWPDDEEEADEDGI